MRAITVETSGILSRRRWPAALAVACVAVALSGCNALMGGGSPTADVFNDGARPAVNSVDSREHARIVAAYGGIFHDAKVEQTLAPIVSKIVAASDRPDQPYRITILNAPAVNAFALPDGYLYVTRGLLALANDSSEVAAVLAHEMGHVTANHAAQRQKKAQDALVVSRVVNDVLDNNEGGQLALAASQRTLAAFSQQQELEADAIGVRTIGRAGYDPFAAARFLNSMQRYAAYQSSLTMQDQRPDFLATHPATPERVAFAIKAARQFGAPGVGTVDRDRYLEGIDGMVYGDDPNQGFVRDRTFVHPGLGIGFTVPEGFRHRQYQRGGACHRGRWHGVALRCGGAGARHPTRRLPEVGLGQRPRRGKRAELLGQWSRRGVGDGRGQGLAFPYRRHPHRRQRHLPLHLRQ